jgi:hypothetical protein
MRSSSIVLLVLLGCGDPEAGGNPARPRTAQPPPGGDSPNGPGGVGMGDPAPAPGTPGTGGPSKKDVFLAVGHMGRAVMSCDDGLTWIHDQSNDDAARCWVDGDPKYVECDHTPYSSPGNGVEFGDGYFYAAYGWGYDGTIRRSADGHTWETIKTGGWGGGVAYANQRVFVAWENGWSTSADRGATWQPVPSSPRDDFDHPFPRSVAGKIVIIGRAGGARPSAVSADGGIGWTSPTGLGASTRWLAEGNGVLVALTGDGNAARSTDGGTGWTSKKVTEEFTTNVVFDGKDFVAWGGGRRWSSPDGTAWTSAPMTINGAVAPPWWSAAASFSPATKTYVAVLSAWGNYYDKQKAYRSTDGLAWSTLDAAHFKGGHPISRIITGQVDAKSCP